MCILLTILYELLFAVWYTSEASIKWLRLSSRLRTVYTEKRQGNHGLPIIKTGFRGLFTRSHSASTLLWPLQTMLSFYDYL